MEGGNQMKPRLKFKKTKKEKEEERNSNARKTSPSEQVVYLCLSVGEWFLLFRQECLPVWDH
jgi:hypothetical protein